MRQISQPCAKLRSCGNSSQDSFASVTRTPGAYSRLGKGEKRWAGLTEAVRPTQSRSGGVRLIQVLRRLMPIILRPRRIDSLFCPPRRRAARRMHPKLRNSELEYDM